MAATMDRTYSVSLKGMLGEKSGSKVLYDKLLKVNAHEQFVDIAECICTICFCMCVVYFVFWYVKHRL